MNGNDRTVNLKVSPETARLIKNASRKEQLTALQEASTHPSQELLTLFLFLFQSGDPELKSAVATALRRVDAEKLAALITNEELHPRHLELIAGIRLNEVSVIGALLKKPLLPVTLLKSLAAHCQGDVFARLAQQTRLLNQYPEVAEILADNQRVGEDVKHRLGLLAEPAAEEEVFEPLEAEEEPPEEVSEADETGEHLSKYQQALDMPVSDKIKVAMTGDKEWRSLLIKEPNKLVSAAVLKNPRITDGEVLAIVKNKSSSEELIRLITLNNEWLKNYEIKRALVMHNRTPLPTAMRFMNILTEKDLMHNRTPLPTAMRFMNILTEKDLKNMAKSREISSVLVNTARRMLDAREKKR